MNNQQKEQQENLDTYYLELRHCDYQLREIKKILKRTPKFNGDPRPKRTKESLKRSFDKINSKLKDSKAEFMPQKIDRKIDEENLADLERCLKSIKHYEESFKILKDELKTKLA